MPFVTEGIEALQKKILIFVEKMLAFHKFIF